MSKDTSLRQYMVEFVVPMNLPPDFTDLIPDQRNHVNQLFMKGKLLSYTLNANRTKLWAVFLTDSESELLHTIDSMPLTLYMDYQYHELLFHQSLRLLPSLSLN